MNNHYIYIIHAVLEPSKCKIGKMNDLERRLKEYNNLKIMPLKKIPAKYKKYDDITKLMNIKLCKNT